MSDGLPISYFHHILDTGMCGSNTGCTFDVLLNSYPTSLSKPALLYAIALEARTQVLGEVLEPRVLEQINGHP